VEGDVPGSAEQERPGPDHYRDPPGAGVLLCRGLSPAVPRQESRGLLRPGRHRRVVSGRSRHGERMRIDKWLWAARFFKTRSLAQQAVAAGRVLLDGERTKP